MDSLLTDVSRQAFSATPRPPPRVSEHLRETSDIGGRARDCKYACNLRVPLRTSELVHPELPLLYQKLGFLGRLLAGQDEWFLIYPGGQNISQRSRVRPLTEVAEKS